MLLAVIILHVGSLEIDDCAMTRALIFCVQSNFLHAPAARAIAIEI